MTLPNFGTLVLIELGTAVCYIGSVFISTVLMIVSAGDGDSIMERYVWCMWCRAPPFTPVPSPLRLGAFSRTSSLGLKYRVLGVSEKPTSSDMLSTRVAPLAAVSGLWPAPPRDLNIPSLSQRSSRSIGTRCTRLVRVPRGCLGRE